MLGRLRKDIKFILSEFKTIQGYKMRPFLKEKSVFYVQGLNNIGKQSFGIA